MSNRSEDPSQFLAYLHDLPGNAWEIRIPDCPQRAGATFTGTYSGYYNDPDSAAEGIAPLEKHEPPSIYCTINPVHPDMLAKACNRMKLAGKKSISAGDDQIAKRRSLLIDIDPSRLSGISSTDAEMEAALALGRAIREWLTARGWPAPLFGMSGNGCYLIYRIDLPNNDASAELVKQCLEALGVEFDTDGSAVDCSTFNASRICAVLGTMKRKGDNVRGVPGVVDRPWRRSWFEVPDGDLQTVPVDLLTELAAMAPVDPEPVSTSNKSYSSSFEIEPWMAGHRIGHRGVEDYRGGTRYQLDACPFNPEHKAPDCVVMVRPDGKLCFHCSHNSCRGKGWQEFRAHFDGPKEERYKQQIEPGVNRLVERMTGGSVPVNVPGQKGPEQLPDLKRDSLPPLVSTLELVAACPALKQPIVENILRQAEVLNINAQSKIGKSFLGYQLGYSIVARLDWLGLYATTPTNLLLCDNELHRETLAYRLPYVAKRLGLNHADYAERFKVDALRGRLCNIFAFERRIEQLEASDWKPGVIILDAFYRMLPPGYSENDNAQMAEVYNAIDSYAERLNCAFVLIHHSTKGSQAEKRVTDVGSGASAMGRAADAHLVLREHEEPGVIVLDAAMRSWRPIEPVCLRWDWPLFVPDDTGLDPKALKRDPYRGGRPRKDKPEKAAKADPCAITAEIFASEFVGSKPVLLDEICIAAKQGRNIGVNLAKGWLRMAVDKGLVHRLPRQPREPQKYSTVKLAELPNLTGESSLVRAHESPVPPSAAVRANGKHGN